MNTYPLFRTMASMATATAGAGADIEADMLAMTTDESETWERRRDARWVYRWLSGLTERTEAALTSATAAANRLGVQLA